MQTDLTNYPPAVLARSHNRDTALSAIVPQIRVIHARRKAEGLDKQLSKSMTTEDYMKLLTPVSSRYSVYTMSEALEGPNAFYVSVHDVDYNAGVFTAWIDPIRPGKNLNGTVHVMSWRRGEWEAALFQ